VPFFPFWYSTAASQPCPIARVTDGPDRMFRWRTGRLMAFQPGSTSKGEGRLLLAMNSRRRACSERGGTDWGHRRSEASGLRTEAQLLQSFCVELPGRIQTVRLLKLFHGVDGVRVPLAAGLAAERTVLGEGALNFGNTLRSGCLLPSLPAGSFSCGFRAVRLRTWLRGRRFCSCSALPFRDGAAYTHTRCHEQRQGQVGRFWHAHRFQLRS